MSFVPRIVYGGIDLTDSPYMVEFGFEFGAPVTTYDVVESFVTDGSIQSAIGSGNRVLTISVLVEASSAAVNADLTTPLHIQAGKQTNTLTFYPGDGTGAATVLETFAAQVDHDWDQDLEQSGLRRYILTIPAWAYARSETLSTLAWTGPGTRLANPISTSGWAVVGAGAIGAYVGGVLQKTTTGQVTVKKTMTLGTYLRIVVDSDGGSAPISAVVINGTSVAATTYKVTTPLGTHGKASILIPTTAWKDTAVEVQFLIEQGVDAGVATLYSVYSVEYPDRGAEIIPSGLGVIHPKGTARAPFSVAFTVPAGGAFLVTTPDPDAAIRERGMGEVLWAKVTAGATGGTADVGSRVSYFQQSTTAYGALGTTDPQPVSLYPNGVWPVAVVAGTSHTLVGLTVNAGPYSYPADPQAAVSFFPTAGAVTVISPGLDLPGGYQPGVVAHHPHVLHPGKCGFMLVDSAGAPIAATITWYERWMHHAAL